MNQAKTKSRTFRKVQVRTVKGSKNVFKKRRPKLGACSVTGESLKGVPRAFPVENRKSSKSAKRPSRPFGGVLSSRAAREEHKKRARQSKL